MPNAPINLLYIGNKGGTRNGPYLQDTHHAKYTQVSWYLQPRVLNAEI